MVRKVVFIFINGSITKPLRSEITFEQGLMITLGVGSYEMACEEAIKMAEEGVILIALCGGFGTIGHAMIKQAVQGKVPVGAVRFDFHPGYDYMSGDSKWL
jgi:hypothetical protein